MKTGSRPEDLQVGGDCEEVRGGPGFGGSGGDGVDDGDGGSLGARGAAASFARGISQTGTPRWNIALARCSAVWTLRSTRRISCARGMRTLYAN